MPSKKSPKISETFEGFGVRMEYGDLELKRGPVAVAGSRGRIGAPLWAAYSFHTFVPLERIARTPREAWENALRAQDANVAALEAALEKARAKRAVIQRELDKVTRDEARKEATQ